jgi:hypothetical protein
MLYIEDSTSISGCLRAGRGQLVERQGLPEKLLDPANVLAGIGHYTARVSGRVDAAAPARQQIASRTVPEILIHMGSFLVL